MPSDLSEKQGADVSALSEALNDANVSGWSTREISERAARAGFNINHATVAKYLNGTHASKPTNDVLEAFAAVFSSLTIQKLRKAAGVGLGEPEPYVPPQEAHQLGARERRAVNEVIRLLAQKSAREGDGDERDAAPMNDEPTVVGVLEARRRRAEDLRQPVRKAARKDPGKKP